jgi:hypothetical protein
LGWIDLTTMCSNVECKNVRNIKADVCPKCGSPTRKYGFRDGMKQINDKKNFQKPKEVIESNQVIKEAPKIETPIMIKEALKIEEPPKTKEPIYYEPKKPKPVKMFHNKPITFFRVFNYSLCGGALIGAIGGLLLFFIPGIIIGLFIGAFIGMLISPIYYLMKK